MARYPAILAVLAAAPMALAQEAAPRWLGPELWANRLQDWQRAGDGIACVAPELPWRTAHWLTRAVSADATGDLALRVRGQTSAGDDETPPPAVGFWIGAGAADLDPRAKALIQAAPGPDGGFLAGIDGAGRAFVRDMRTATEDAPPPAPTEALPRDRWTVVTTAAGDSDAPPVAVIDLGLAHTIGGLHYRPGEPAARPARWALFAAESLDAPLGEPAAAGAFRTGAVAGTLHFVPITARYLRFVTYTKDGPQPAAGIAELTAVPAGVEAPRRPDAFVLEARIEPIDAERCRLTVIASAEDGREWSRAERDDVPPGALEGALALACGGGAASAVEFRDWTATGSRLEVHADRAFGPIAGVQYTWTRGVLKLTAQLLPIEPGALDGPLRLAVKTGSKWREIATTDLVTPGWTAAFRVEDFAADGNASYRVTCRLANGDEHGFEGVIRREPDGTRPLVLAAFTGDHQVKFGFGQPGFPWNRQGLWFPQDDLVAHVRAIDPDLLFFSGDQIYEGASPTKADRRDGGIAELDYLYKWLLWVWAFRDLTRDRPTVTLPDDHDVFQGNLWGAGGRQAKRDHDGGYVMPAAWVAMVERTQTSHLPDAFDATPIAQGIGVHYGRFVYGGVDFAILEDRKFKSGPNGLVPPTSSGRPDWVVDEAFDPDAANVAGATLLGARQLEFLEDWAGDWSGGARMKATLSPTVFAGLATHHGSRQAHVIADYDSNGWPQAGRDAALRAIRKGSATLIGGDQHLATLAHLGIDAWRDAGWSFAVPSIANFYPRAWRPETTGAHRAPAQPGWAGDHLDGFGNRVSVWAVTNPDGPTGRQPASLHDGRPGFGVVRFDTQKRTITFECWPRAVDPSAPDAANYPGWPQTIHQLDNRRPPTAWLPELRVFGLGALPVVQVRDPSGDLLWALRAPRTTFRPWAFAPGPHHVRVGDPDSDRWRELELEAVPNADDAGAVDVAF